jgi:hypothetical protein
MRDPQPENIMGEKVQRHAFEHKIDWGQVALAGAGAFAIWAIFLRGSGSSGDDETDPEVVGR